MNREPDGDNAMDLAVKRLERAVARLEQEMSHRTAQAGQAQDPDRELAAELDRARARERDLESAGAEASAALGRAIAEIRAALDGPTPAQRQEA